jgi:hypothetical protein
VMLRSRGAISEDKVRVFLASMIVGASGLEDVTNGLTETSTTRIPRKYGA